MDFLFYNLFHHLIKDNQQVLKLYFYLFEVFFQSLFIFH